MNRNILFLAALAVLFFAGIISLFQLRFQRGDIYPPYSSLRADPLGVKALYESFETCCNFSVSRHYDPFRKRVGDTNAVIFFLGVEANDFASFPETIVKQLDTFLRNGGRLVFVYLPVKSDLEKPSELSKEEEEDFKLISLNRHWGFDPETKGGREALPARRNPPAPEDLPEEITAHTRLYLTNLDPAWNVIYTVGRNPVFVERQWGKGSLIVSTISYFLSNEAMVKERHTNLLLHLLGSRRPIVFDEYHLGISDNPGVAYFVRKYRLEWVVAGLLLLAGLFIWKNALPFIPPDRSESASSLTKGKESIEGLTNLLRRNIPEQNLIAVCWEQWNKGRSFFRGASRLNKNKLEGIDSKIKGKQDKVFEAYNEIAEMLKERERP